jgi:UDP-N-acetylmuramoyl-tripeptide--D-alanyl-D-alanine ligase
MNYFLLLAFEWFLCRRLLTYLHIYQQEEYQSGRFLRWLFASKSFDVRATIAAALGGFLELFIRPNYGVGAIFLALAFTLIASREPDPRKASKKRLTITDRAKRIFFLALAAGTLAGVLLTVYHSPLLTWIPAIQAIPLYLCTANFLLSPYESRIQRQFWEEAHRKLQAQRPIVVGITGSYGKTSTKHILGHILELHAPTLITPGSVNTPMGIARIIREQLGPHHRFFVCEMGAYGIGSIARLCRLAPPDVGVITAIGKAHYERFKTLEAVATAKFELAHAVARRSGTMVLHEQVLNFPAAQQALRLPNLHVQVVGAGPSATARIHTSGQTSEGIFATIEWQGQHYQLHAPLYGEHHIANMVLAFASACTLGVDPRDAVLALASTPQIKHRLELKEGPAQSRLIDDAYNSNPVGFESALKLLQILRTDNGRTILVTPGMVELGAAHDEDHHKIGRLAGQHADVLVPVLPERIPTLVKGYRETNPQGILVPTASFTDAQRWLQENVRNGDVVLLENDLPDLYEKKLRL